jgi:hypothetical protein
MLYVAKRVKDGAIKVGRTTCVEKRLRDLARTYESDFELIRTEDVADSVEQEVQHTLRPWATDEGREWFLPDAELIEMVTVWPIDKLAATRQQRRGWSLPGTEFTRILEACYYNGQSMSNVVRKAIDYQVAREKGLPPVPKPPMEGIARTSILVDDVQYAAATEAARSRGKTFSAWLLEAVDAWLSENGQEKTHDSR